jgi:Stealth protein CR2, conserved region 2/Stealth protein CR4, conserved region 4/Stealth protein CR1, conserved region 1
LNLSFISAPPDSTAVDIVYLWVNGQDSIWRKKRDLAAQSLSASETNHLALYSNVEGRFRDNDELRYNLRALERFFPEHGHIYIVTDSQTPNWLKPIKGVSIVDHTDLIPKAVAPTFDSGNIESYIHRIPGLSERFFYLNDDVFFGAPVVLNEWFFDTGIYVAWSADAPIEGDTMNAESTALVNASRLSKQWLTDNAANTANAANATYQHTPRTFAHSPRPTLKSMMMALEDIAPELFKTVRSTVFRAWDKPTIVSDFVMRWALENGHAQVRQHRHLHLSTGDDNIEAQYDALSRMFGQLTFFCINDTLDDAHASDIRLKKARDALQKLLPKPSVFERTLP